ncbi:MAG: ATP-binding cassette domain-containing protein [Hungatella hathewayi]
MEDFVIRMADICTDSFPESPIQFQAASGEITAIIGNNGEGKTTLAKVLAGIIPKRSGHIYLNDSELDIHSIASAHRNGIFLLQESLQLFPGKNVMDNFFARN